MAVGKRARAALRALLLACVLAAPLGAVGGDTGNVSQIEAGRAIYNFRCYFCHGYSGNAKTLAATYLTPPPADFTQADPKRLTVDHVVGVLENGRPGTAMKSFRGVIGRGDMERVAAFVVSEFVQRKAVNTRYHTPENGWQDHERFAAAFPFAKGEIPLSRPWENLTPEQAKGKRLFLATCVSCHDRGAADDDGEPWDARPLSYPRNNYLHTAPPVDATTSASAYAKHDVVPRIAGLTALERRGQKLFQANCAFCHGADGTGKNWIGSFLEPHPRNLTSPEQMRGMTATRLTHTIREGLPGTSMPAWKDVLRPADIRAVVAYVNRAFYRLEKE